MVNATTTGWEMTSSIPYFYNNSATPVTDYCHIGIHEKYLFSVLYSLVFVVGFIGNALVVWVITVGTQLKTMTDVGLLNLALADLLLVLPLPFLLYGWIFGKVMCALVHGIHHVGYYGGIFFIVLMSIDRYLAVVHAVVALRTRTKACGIVASLVIWILAVAASFPELLYFRVRGDPDGQICSSLIDMIVILKMNIVGLLVPLIIVGFCYSMILWRLHRSHSPKKHSIRLIVLIMVVFFCCWVPYNIALFLQGLLLMRIIPSDCKTTKRLYTTIKITEVMAYSHSCLNPFLYVFAGEKFRRHLVRLIRERRPVCCS